MKYKGRKSDEPLFAFIERDKFIRSADRAMIEFLRAIARVAPEVLSSLSRDVLPLYKPIFSSEVEYDREFLTTVFANEITFGFWGRMPIEDMPDKLIEDPQEGNAFRRLRSAIYRWAKRYHLDGYILDSALLTLQAWCEHKIPEGYDWEYKLIRPVVYDPKLGFQFDYPSWQQESDTWLSYEKKLDESFSAIKQAYKEQMLQKPLSKKVIAKYKPEHFEWLVCFQIKEMAYKDVYLLYRQPCNIGTVKAVEKAVKEAASLLNLQLRKSGKRRGRPPKS